MNTIPYPKRHTSGPWAFHPVDLCVFDAAVRMGVATILKQGDGRDDDLETSANGYLIAAAPMMYDALLIAENWIRELQMYETAGSGEYQQHESVLSILHSTIAEAEGTR